MCGRGKLLTAALLCQELIDSERFIDSGLLTSLLTETMGDKSLQEVMDGLSTLVEYLRRGCDPKETATAMFIHRNTLLYRLKRIEEICGFDLNDHGLRTRLLCSTAIDDYLRRTQV